MASINYYRPWSMEPADSGGGGKTALLPTEGVWPCSCLQFTGNLPIQEDGLAILGCPSWVRYYKRSQEMVLFYLSVWGMKTWARLPTCVTSALPIAFKKESVPPRKNTQEGNRYYPGFSGLSRVVSFSRESCLCLSNWLRHMEKAIAG